ncbi:MAG: aldo/keto reductase [Bacteroidales bacterium]|jgi:aryl-alcohol dehydrogenase-like predicted oxidoreductase|nr:aldo/keto reductase [Bacteroidales bacterium]
MKITRRLFLRLLSAGFFGLGMKTKISFGAKSFLPVFSKVKLGRTGMSVKPLAFGAARTQESGLLKAALDSGMNFIDTGRSYADGQNEVMIGKTIKEIRKQVVIQSKVKIPFKPGEKDKITGHLQKELEASLKALQTDFIDIFLYHMATKEDLLFDKSVMGFFKSAKEKGLIRAHGFSTHSNQVELIKANNRHGGFYDVVMVTINPHGAFVHSMTGRKTSWDQKALFTELREARKKGVSVLAMKTCSGGPFAYDKADQPNLPGAIRWVIDQPEVDCAIVAMANYKEIAENTGIFEG